MSVFTKQTNRGHESVMTVDNANKIIDELTLETKIQFINKNPKKLTSKAGARFSVYMKSKTVKEYMELNPDHHGPDFRYDLTKGFVTIK